MNDRLHQESGGAGPPLVCLHGWGLNLRVFDGLRAELAARHEVIGIDLPGHGASPWDAKRADFAAQVEWLLASLPPSCALLGWSLGGQFALALARRAPQRVLKLLLVTTTPRFTAAPDWPAGMSAGVFADFEAQLARDWRQTVGDFLQLQLRGSRDAARSLQQLEAALRAHGEAQPQALAADLAILRDLDLRAELDAITMPTLVISGQHDRITPAEAGSYLACRLPAAQFIELSRAGHVPFLSQPAEFAALSRRFLEAA